uniref:Uncharacterized protein n=1 Tax=Bos indicus x Bos taurus TaxID=30522 RepID=A0A4W2GW51_BOBOX
HADKNVMSALKPLVYGGLASIKVERSTFPIDLTKTRLQIQGQKNDANFKEIRYGGMLHALVRIGREEGLKALYSGIQQVRTGLAQIPVSWHRTLCTKRLTVTSRH